MIPDVDLDRTLATWFAEGSERAPSDDVAAAMRQVASTAQRRRPLVWLGGSRFRVDLRWALVAVLALLAAAAIVGVGSGIIAVPFLDGRDPAPPSPVAEVPSLGIVAPTPDPTPALSPAASLPATPSPVSGLPVPLQHVTVKDWAAEVGIPVDWEEVDPQCCDYRVFAGTEPEGRLSVGNEGPYATAVCVPECLPIEVSGTIPYSAAAQTDALRAAVSDAVGDPDWTPVPEGTVGGLVDGVRFDSTAVAADGRTWRGAHIVGLRARNLVSVSWSQPEAAWDEGLFAAVLANVVLGDAPVYSDGDLVAYRTPTSTYTMPVPGLWGWSEQPTLDGVAISGLDRIGDGRALVSIGGVDGSMGWCKASCLVMDGLLTTDTLVQALRPEAAGEPADVVLGGEPAIAWDDDATGRRRTVVAVHDGRPVAVRLDAGDWTVGPGIFDEMIAGFRFAAAPKPIVGSTYSTAGGRAEITLPDGWQRARTGDEGFLGQVSRILVRAGSREGTIATCDHPAAPWDLCREITVGRLDELAAAVSAAPIDDHGIGPPVSRVDDTTLDGEPAKLVRTQAYEYPAKGGQEVAYIVAFHDGRPFIVRFWTSRNELPDLRPYLAAFRFTDP